MGALSYLIKPLSMSQLQDVLSRAVQCTEWRGGSDDLALH